MGDWQVGPPNSYITIYPGWETSQEKTFINVSHQRRRDGSLKSYQEPGNFEKFEIPLSWVSSGDRALVNSWAENITDLRLIPDSDFAFTVPMSLSNGDFETGGSSPWQTSIQAPASGSIAISSDSPYEGNYKALATIDNPGSTSAGFQFYHGSLSVVTSETYQVRFAGMAVSSRTIDVKLIKHVTPFTNYGLEETITLINSWQVFELEFTANATADDARINFYLGIDTANVSLDNIEFHPGSFYDVRITNVQEPLTSAVRPYENFYQGEVVFETI